MGNFWGSELCSIVYSFVNMHRLDFHRFIVSLGESGSIRSLILLIYFYNVSTSLALVRLYI